jgi:3-deoxy-D-manno-octulosonic-acid transferase
MAGSMRLLYLCIGHCLAPIAFLRELWRAARQPAYRPRLGTRLGFGATVPPGSIWIHAVSVGEVQAAGPLLRRLAAAYPTRPLVLTASTATGRQRAAALYGTTADVRYLPYDLPGCVNRFLDRVSPAVGVILETELWPTLFGACRRRGIPLCVVSARLSERSVRRYRRVAPFVAQLLGTPRVYIAAQTETDRDRFVALGARVAQTIVCGNVKYDQRLPADLPAIAASRRTELGRQRPVWVAGSTHEGEEVQVLAAHRLLLQRDPTLLLVLAPRHPPRFDGVADLLDRQGFRSVRRTSGAANVPATAEVLLLDTLGELVVHYAAANAAFVGGSLVPIGGHNLLEPLAAGCPACTGPSNHNDARTAQLLCDAGAVEVVADAGSLAAAIHRFLAEPQSGQERLRAAEAILTANQGAVDRVFEQLRPLLEPGEPISGP